MGHVSLGMVDGTRKYIGECFYCGRQFVYGERSDCVSCGGLLPLNPVKPVKPASEQRTPIHQDYGWGLSAGGTSVAGSCRLVDFGWTGIHSKSRIMSGS